MSMLYYFISHIQFRSECSFDRNVTLYYFISHLVKNRNVSKQVGGNIIVIDSTFSKICYNRWVGGSISYHQFSSIILYYYMNLKLSYYCYKIYHHNILLNFNDTSSKKESRSSQLFTPMILFMRFYSLQPVFIFDEIFSKSHVFFFSLSYQNSSIVYTFHSQYPKKKYFKN